MINLDKNLLLKKYEEYSAGDFIIYITDSYLEAVGGSLTAENMGMLSNDQHSILCYRYILDEVMEGGFIQLIANGYAPYVLEGAFPYVVKKEWGMREFSKLLYDVKRQYYAHKDELLADMDEEEFMALYEQMEELNDFGDEFLDDIQEDVTPTVAKMVIENLEKYA